MKTKQINEEVINGKLYFYHSTRNLNAAMYIVNQQWKTNLGMYGNGIYGQQYPDPTSKKNKLSQSTIDRYKHAYGGSYRFKIRYDNPEDIFYLDLDAGREVYGKQYDRNMAIDILKQHNVPQNIIDNISNYFSEGNDTPAISTSMFATYKVTGGLLGQYGFKGLAYHGNQDGKCLLFWYPNEGHLTVEAYSTDFGKTWTAYDSSNASQVKALRQEIQDKINQHAGAIQGRRQQKQSDGRTPLLQAKGKDRDWIRVIECGDKAGYDFLNGDFTSGNIREFANLVQRQINASKEPKRSNRYNAAIEILPDSAQYLSI